MRIIDLIATYEELFNVPEEKKVTEYYGDYGIHVLKYKKIISNELKKKALDAIGLTNEEFLNNNDFVYRGNIITKMCHHSHIEVPNYL